MKNTSPLRDWIHLRGGINRKTGLSEIMFMKTGIPSFLIVKYKILSRIHFYRSVTSVKILSINCEGCPIKVDTEKSFRNLIISTRHQILFTIFRLNWIQINQKMVNTIWFRIDLITFRKYFSVCTLSEIMSVKTTRLK